MQPSFFDVRGGPRNLYNAISGKPADQSGTIAQQSGESHEQKTP